MSICKVKREKAATKRGSTQKAHAAKLSRLYVEARPLVVKTSAAKLHRLVKARNSKVTDDYDFAAGRPRPVADRVEGMAAAIGAKHAAMSAVVPAASPCSSSCLARFAECN